MIPQVFRWRIEGERPLALTRALPFARAARAAIMSGLKRHGLEKLPDGFHHAEDGGDSAFWLPEDEDGDGLIDHLLCVHAAGLPEQLLPVFAAGGWAGLGSKAAGGGSSRWRLAPALMAPLTDGGLFGPARRWRSVTPYVTPRETRRPKGEGATIRKERTIEKQLVHDLGQRGFPAPAGFSLTGERLCGGALLSASDFELSAEGSRPPASNVSAFAEIVFAGPVQGPLALGYGAHWGLGLFEPAG